MSEGEIRGKTRICDELQVQAHLGGLVGSVPDHSNKANIPIK